MSWRHFRLCGGYFRGVSNNVSRDLRGCLSVSAKIDLTPHSLHHSAYGIGGASPSSCHDDDHDDDDDGKDDDDRCDEAENAGTQHNVDIFVVQYYLKVSAKNQSKKLMIVLQLNEAASLLIEQLNVARINLSATGKACCDEKTNANADWRRSNYGQYVYSGSYSKLRMHHECIPAAISKHFEIFAMDFSLNTEKIYFLNLDKYTVNTYFENERSGRTMYFLNHREKTTELRKMAGTGSPTNLLILDIRTKVSQEQAAMRAGKKGGRGQPRRRPWKATRNNIAMNTRVSAITRNCDL
ncbi:hypothetical protein G5I_02549 [Acromyrmex echinatior]|uniref:Uncharacterized protein n=1 Tax=Acromyrmex echinatior TaxID=103372 RepID=F4WAL1_ACREC|nr:hypothetical protein G5I_02549 [Acromyrmex echinatior]